MLSALLADTIIAIAIAFYLYCIASLLWPWLTGAGYSPTSSRKAKLVLEMAKVEPQDIFYDLGCGTGPVLAEAKKRTTHVVGIEIEPLRWLICKLSVRGAKVILGDMYKVPLSDATVVFIFQRPGVNTKLRDKFENELKPGTRVVSNAWKIEGWEPVKIVENLYLYIAGRK
jgi:precorrin-6B methylase 2